MKLTTSSTQSSYPLNRFRDLDRVEIRNKAAELLRSESPCDWAAGKLLEELGVQDPKLHIAVDFDGVIHNCTSGWQGTTAIPDDPSPGAIDWLKSLLADDRFLVSIFSCRNHLPEGPVAITVWLLSHGLSSTEIKQLKFPIKKPSAHLYVDDRGWQFRGVFPTKKTMLGFKPWNTQKAKTSP